MDEARRLHAVPPLVVRELDPRDIATWARHHRVDAIVQAGTNLSTVNIFPTLEHQLKKPVIPINVATIWHTFRAMGIEDRFHGKGWLMERF